MIEAGWKGGYRQWVNAVKLAGGLKIVETAPALAKWISLDNVGSETSAAEFEQLDTSPAGKARSQMGNPAIPTLVGVLERGTRRERRNAYFVLYQIGTAESKAAIHARANNEPDPDLQSYIKKTPE
jgi:hypothetical protein